MQRTLALASRIALSAVIALFAAACGDSDVPRSDVGVRVPTRARVEMAGERFSLELALDPATRHQGLSGRSEIPSDGGMLFVFPSSHSLMMVMRDCPVPIDVAFLDESGAVLAVHAMGVEPPRRPGERPYAYDARLPTYGSGVPARFAIETAGGRLSEIGLRPGDRVVLDARSLIARAR